MYITITPGLMQENWLAGFRKSVALKMTLIISSNPAHSVIEIYSF